MNRRTWKEFITKRSTIWTLSLCLVGAIVLGGIAAVNSSPDSDGPSAETEPGQVAYLEEELNSAEGDGSITSEDTDGLQGASGSSSLDDTADAASSGVSADGTVSSSLDSAVDIRSDSALTDSNSDTVLSGVDTDGSSDSTLAGISENDSSNSALDDADTDDSSDSALTDTDNNSDNLALTDADSDTQEASSTGILLSEQTLLDAGVSFTDADSLLWPSAGTIVIDYSMDKSVYFSTLNQYKYNPALVISSETGNQVLASAKGIVESIYIDEETGTTLVVNIGDGYKLTYGQLKELAVSEGDVAEAGELLAYVSEPTKYYVTEGSNLYFAMTKDGEPVDPILYLE